jgi:hypothetical protein
MNDDNDDVVDDVKKNESEFLMNCYYKEKKCNSFDVIPHQPSHTSVALLFFLKLETNTHIHNRKREL